MTDVRLASLLVLAIACGPHAPVRPTPRPAPHDASAPGAAAGVGERECDELFAHVVALGGRDEPAATDDDRRRTSDELRAKHGWQCRAMSRDSYSCAMAATTLAALVQCDDPAVENTAAAPAR